MACDDDILGLKKPLGRLGLAEPEQSLETALSPGSGYPFTDPNLTPVVK